MTKRTRCSAIALLLLAAAACGSARGSPLYRRDIGTASALDAMTLAEQVLSRRGYEIDRREESSSIRIVTEWRPRELFADEAAIGLTDAESRIIIDGRQRAQTELGALYNVSLMMENRVRVAGSRAWSETINTEMFKDYADEITDDFRTLVTNIAVRRFRCC